MSKGLDQVERLLALVPYLLQHECADVDTTAERFGISARQLRKDLDVLSWCGLPGLHYGEYIEIDVNGVNEDGVIRLSNADYLGAPLRFTADEAMSLAVALQTLISLADGELQAAAQSALAKIETEIGAIEGMNIGVVAGDDVIRAVLNDALRTRKAIDLEYISGTSGQHSTPRVDAGRLVTRDGYAYLDAWNHDKGEWRSYRLDRIVTAVLTDHDAHHHGVPPAWEYDWFTAFPDAAEVVLTVTSEGKWVLENHPTFNVTTQPDGTTRFTVLVADPDWLQRLLLRLGPDVITVDPQQARRAAQRAASEALACYAGLDG